MAKLASTSMCIEINESYREVAVRGKFVILLIFIWDDLFKPQAKIFLGFTSYYIYICCAIFACVDMNFEGLLINSQCSSFCFNDERSS